MRPCVCLSALLATALLPAGLPSAAAQTANMRRAARISRPSAQGASSVLGGQYTRAGAFRSLEAPRRDVALLGQDQFMYTRTNQRGTERPSVLSVSQVGLYGNLVGPRGVPLSWAGQRTGGASLLSGLLPANSLNATIPGVRRNYLPALNAHLYTPRVESSRFQDYFGLTPTRPELKPGARTINSVAEQLETQTELRIRRAEQDGLVLFKKATVERRDLRTQRYPNCRDCADNLDESFRLFALVRDLDEEAYLPCLLMVHVALEQERPMLASVYLRDAFQRNQDFFSEKPEALHLYFGDVEEGDGESPTLYSQMRRYARLGELNPSSTEAQLLAAYCAWRIGDTERAREAAELAEELARAAGQPDKYAPMLSFARAVQKATP